MKKNVLFRTNFAVCAVIIIGFLVTSFISYRSNQGIFRKDVERVSELTSEGIYHQIDSIFTKPINISLTMANDSLLRDFLDGESQHLEDPEFTGTMRDYLGTYRDKYGYDSVFLASVQTKRYYYFDGLDRILEEGDPENVWFYDFLASDEDYGIQIDNDQVDGAGNEVTVFINCRIAGSDGETIGVVGVGFRVNSMQELLKSYESDFGVRAFLVDGNGNVEISGDSTKYEGESDLFAASPFSSLRAPILGNREEVLKQWYSSQKGNGYAVSRYIGNLNWFLIIDHDTTVLDQKLTIQLLREVLIVALTILLVLVTITTVIRRYNRKIIELVTAAEEEHKTVFRQATEQFYENIYEIDITNNRAASEAAVHYFEELGAPSNVAYDKALRIIAEKQIKEEHREGYLETFSPEHVLKSYENGVENLRYDFMITSDGETYYWIRISAHIFYWEEDNSVRMMVYRQNIDEEKRRELYMMEQMQKDLLTGLYTKVATQEHVRRLLERRPEGTFAFFILDIDHFKAVNDHLGHAAGDAVLAEFARTLREEFRKEDIVGRIGGDEFVAFMPVPNRRLTEERAERLVTALRRMNVEEAGSWKVTASIGVALIQGEKTEFQTMYKRADHALYEAKKRGRNRYVIASDESYSGGGA